MQILICLIATTILMAFSPLAFSQPTVDPEAEKILKKLQNYMQTQDTVAIEAVITEDEVFNDTHKLQFGGTIKMLMRRQPPQLSVTTNSDYRNTRTYLNKNTFTAFDEDVNVYAQVDAPGTLKEALTHLNAEYSILQPGSELFSGQPYELLVGKASKVIYVGTGNVNGSSCHHIAGILPDMDWQLWIRAEGDPMICKYVLTDRDIPLAPQYSMTFTKWKTNTKLTDKQFEFQPPADAEAIEIIK
ncbi:MAG: DUF2092 domain-containing protein [Arenicellales bacterium]